MYHSGTQKFYKQAHVETSDSGFTLLLDGRPVKTPAGSTLSVLSERLAQEIAREWTAQQDTIDPHTMPLTALACTMLDRIIPEQAAVKSQLLRFAATDLLCYRAQEPADLAARQHAVWQPLIDWVAERHHAPMQVTQGILPVPQPQTALESLSSAIDRLQDWELAALSSITAIAGSLIIGLAVIAGRIDAEEAFAIVQLDEDFQNERWGTVEEASHRQRILQNEIQSAVTFVELARP